MLKFGLAAAATMAAMAFAAPAQAGVLQHLQVKVGISDIAPDESADISLIGGDVDISDEVVPTVALEYFLNDNVSLELLCCAAKHDVQAVNTSLGRVDLGTVWHSPPTLTVKYRWTNLGAFQPYVGAGVNYTHFFSEDLPSGGPVTDISYDDSWGGALQVGADYRLNDHWAINLDARRIWINSDVTIHAGATRIDANVDVNPWVFTAAVGYRF